MDVAARMSSKGQITVPKAVRDALVPGVVLAELVDVMESVYGLAREQVAEIGRAVVGFPSVVVTDPEEALRTLEVYERHRVR